MNKHIAYNFVLIFTIIQCVKSQDNDPDQPSDDEEDEDNFDVLDLDKIIQQRISRFDDPQYQPQYQQIEESQYPTQPQFQPQHFPGYQPETQEYQPESSEYQPELSGYQPEEFGQYQPEHQYYPGYQQEHQQYQSDTYGYYEPQQFGHYQPQHYQSYQAPTHPIGQQYVGYQHYEQSGVSQLGQYYVPPATQPSQPSYQHYYPGYPPQQPSYQYYEPPQQPQQPSYQYYLPPPHQQPQQIVQSQIVEEDDDFYVTEHDQPIQGPSATETEAVPETTQQSIKPQKKPRKRKRTRTTSGDEEEEEDEEEPANVQLLISSEKSSVIKLFKRDSSGKLVEMSGKDYVVTFSDSHKRKYRFISNLEQLECNNEIIYVHASGTPYCFSLSHSKKTHIIIMTNSDGFVLIKKNYGRWERTDYTIPDYVKIYTKDIGGNELLLTIDHYIIDLTSFGSFKYTFLPGIKCTKIIVDGMVAWEKTYKDNCFPEIIYVTPKLTVILNFEKYTKTLERRVNTYQLLRKKLNLKRLKYS